jgi:hypothetical protein
VDDCNYGWARQRWIRDEYNRDLRPGTQASLFSRAASILAHPHGSPDRALVWPASAWEAIVMMGLQIRPQTWTQRRDRGCSMFDKWLLPAFHCKGAEQTVLLVIYRRIPRSPRRPLFPLPTKQPIPCSRPLNRPPRNNPNDASIHRPPGGRALVAFFANRPPPQWVAPSTDSSSQLFPITHAFDTETNPDDANVP